MSESMIERVARAIAESFKERISSSAEMPFEETGVKLPGDSVWLPYARAAIEAMREPTQDMRNRGSWHRHCERMTWQAMIDAALNEQVAG